MAPHIHSPTASIAITGLLVGSSLALTACDQPGPTAPTSSSDAPCLVAPPRIPGLYGRAQLRRGCDATSDAISLNAS
jgi:hypothetical protein